MRDEQTDPDIVRRIQNAIDALPSPIFIKDGDCRYIACNRAFEKYIGLARSAIVGATVHDVAPAELAAIYEKADRDLLADGGRKPTRPACATPTAASAMSSFTSRCFTVRKDSPTAFRG